VIRTFEDIWKCLNDSDETVEIEAKTAQQIGPALLETISAFSNEPNRGGGYLLLGVRRIEASLTKSKVTWQRHVERHSMSQFGHQCSYTQ